MHPRTLVIGFGNPAREDDALGPAAAEIIENLAIEGVEVDSDYQLTVEDAAAVSEHDRVVFVDAAVEGEEPFSFTETIAKREQSISSHSVSAEAVLGLAEELFGAKPEAHTLAIRGYSFEMFTEQMTDNARSNLEKAVEFLEGYLRMQK